MLFVWSQASSLKELISGYKLEVAEMKQGTSGPGRARVAALCAGWAEIERDVHGGGGQEARCVGRSSGVRWLRMPRVNSL